MKSAPADSKPPEAEPEDWLASVRRGLHPEHVAALDRAGQRGPRGLPQEHRWSPVAADGTVYPGPWERRLWENPHWVPCAEEELPGIERQALGVLIRLGFLQPGDPVPWRGDRERFVADLLRAIPDPSGGADGGALAALAALVAVERADRGDAEAVAGCLASMVADADLVNAGRAAAQQRAAAQRGRAELRARPELATGRPNAIDAELRGRIQRRAAELAGKDPAAPLAGIVARVGAEFEAEIRKGGGASLRSLERTVRKVVTPPRARSRQKPPDSGAR